MSSIWTITKRELAGYFYSPVAYVFLVIFLLMTGAFTFLIGQFMDSNQASLRPFFQWHPWLYLFLVPAVGMRLWSEERRLGTMELLLTMPISLWHCIVGKFIASLGYDPDTGVTYEVFFSRRGKKAGDSGISEDLYELGVAISKEMQNLLGKKNGNI